MLWKKTWQPESVLMLGGIILLSYFSANIAVGILRHYHIAGFQTAEDVGYVLLATLAFHGAALAAGLVFLRINRIGWREVLGLDRPDWKRRLSPVLAGLAVAVPVMIGLKIGSDFILKRLGWPVDDQLAVEMILKAKTVWLNCYLAFFTTVLAPAAEEFVFRGLIFSALKKIGWTKTAWVGTSLLFAFIHFNLPIFLPLFAFALALTWMYQKTEGLLAPMLAHSFFNAANLTLLLLAQKYAPHPA